MKKLIALLLALVMVAGLVACGAKEEAAAPAATEAAPAATEAAPAEKAEEAAPAEGEYKYKVAFCTISVANDTMVNQADNMVAYGKQHGVEVVVFDNKADAQQVLQNAEIIARDGTYDGVLNFNVDASISETLMGIYNDAGLKVISIDVEHPGSPFFGADNYKCGQLCGEFVVDYIKTNWNGELDAIFVADQVPAGDLPRQRVLNALPYISEGLGVNAEEIAYILDCKDSMQVQTDFASYLQANPDADQIAAICLTEDYALGVQAAAAAAGREDQVVCVTNNEDFTISQWEEENEESCVKACISFTFTHYGKWLIPAMVELLETGSVADYTYVGHEVITRDNMAAYRAEYPSRLEG